MYPNVPRDMSRNNTTIDIFRCLTGSMMDADYLLVPQNSSVIMASAALRE
jgi:hypothetical protein